tara:strand:+ start:9359 stop:10198 length:840 start_codon:yes stop_codon:yes gene_type:complete
MSKKGVIKKLADHGSIADQYLSSKAGGYVLDFYSVATGRAVSFKGFMTQFEDRYQASYNSENVYGRMDPIMTYQGTVRNISFTFDIVAVNITEAVSNLARIENLVTLLYPKYNSGEIETIQATPLIKVKFANMIVDAGALPPVGDPILDDSGRRIRPAGSVAARDLGLLGAIEAFNYAPNFEPGMFMTNNGKTYPKHVEMNCEMTVLHTHKLGWDDDNAWRGDKAGATQGMAYPYGTHSLTRDGSDNRRRDDVGNFVNTTESRFDNQKNRAKNNILGGN